MVRRSFLLACVLLLLLGAVAPGALAQTTPPQQPAAPTTGEPAPTPRSAASAARQGTLALAKAYLDGGDYANASRLYAGILEQEPGNVEAAAGLKASLAGRARASDPQSISLLDGIVAKTRELGVTVAAGLILLALVFLLALAVRWTIYWAREQWLTRGLPLTGRPAIDPPFLMGEFVDAVAEPGLAGGQIVRQALTEKLLAWNQLVEVRITPVEPALPPHLDSAAWLRAFWQWVAPPSRGFEVRGALYRNGQAYGLAVQRISLRRRSVDCGQTFESSDAPAADAYRAMAGEAAKWLLQPDDMEAAIAPQGSRAVSPDGPLPDQLPPTASEAFDRALTLLLPVRHMLQQGALDEADARCRLEEAREMAVQLPAQSGLRREIESAVVDLGKLIR